MVDVAVSLAITVEVVAPTIVNGEPRFATIFDISNGISNPLGAFGLNNAALATNDPIAIDAIATAAMMIDFLFIPIFEPITFL